GVLYKASALGILAICLAMSAVAVGWWWHGQITGNSVILVLFYSAFHYTSSVNSCCFLFVLTNHLFCLVEIFRLKLKKYSKLLQLAAALGNPILADRFAVEYAHLL